MFITEARTERYQEKEEADCIKMVPKRNSWNPFLNTRFNQENVRKHLFSFFHPTPIFSSWLYCLSFRIENSYSATKFIIKLHYDLFKDKVDLRRCTENQSTTQFNVTNMHWMSRWGKVCLRWLAKGGGWEDEYEKPCLWGVSSFTVFDFREFYSIHLWGTQLIS